MLIYNQWCYISTRETATAIHKATNTVYCQVLLREPCLFSVASCHIDEHFASVVVIASQLHKRFYSEAVLHSPLLLQQLYEASGYFPHFTNVELRLENSDLIKAV